MKRELTREEKIEKLVRCRLGLIKAQSKNRIKRCSKHIIENVNKQGKKL